MKEEEILKRLELPKQTHVLKTFPYNKLVTQLNDKYKKLFPEAVEVRGIRLLATLNTRNTNIPMYEDEFVRFEEIHLFCIRLKNIKKAKDIYTGLAEVMPYPLIILFESKGKYQWIAALHKKQENSYLLKMEQIYSSNADIPIEKYLSQWTFGKMDTFDLKSYYHMFIKKMVDLQLKEQYQVTTENAIENHLLERIQSIDKEILNLVSRAKKEKQMNKRIALQVEANKLKDKKTKLLRMENKNE